MYYFYDYKYIIAHKIIITILNAHSQGALIQEILALENFY